jgi:hypothetical protein
MPIRRRSAARRMNHGARRVAGLATSSASPPVSENMLAPPPPALHVAEKELLTGNAALAGNCVRRACAAYSTIGLQPEGYPADLCHCTVGCFVIITLAHVARAA